MKAVVALALVTMSILYVANYTFPAAIDSEEFAQELEKIIRETDSDSRQRYITERLEDKPKRNCYDILCGWNTYATRRAIYFMSNTCSCPDDACNCVHTGEVLSISLYVYHCRQNTTADDIEEIICVK